MRKFRFVGDPSEYSRWVKRPVQGDIYNEEKHAEYYGSGSKSAWRIIDQHKDWQEVFEEPIKPLHKDTDLGYYSFEIMKSLCSNPNATFSNEISNSIFVSDCIELAKELIKQLDAESK